MSTCSSTNGVGVGVGNGKENKEQYSASGTRSIKRTWSANESSMGLGGHGSKACVCAPTTHAGSFKCRLHRVNSHSHSTDTHTHTQSAPQPSVTTSCSSSTRTVEAL